MYNLISYKKDLLDQIKELFIEYQKELGHDLNFQDFETELSSLPGKYSEPDGSILLLHDNETMKFAGCVALKRHDEKTCEMKRLFVRTQYRSKGYAKILVEEIIKIAKKKQYSFMVLDSLLELKPAQCLYKKYGFKEIDAYYPNPLKGVVYMGREL